MDTITVTHTNGLPTSGSMASCIIYIYIYMYDDASPCEPPLYIYVSYDYLSIDRSDAIERPVGKNIQTWFLSYRNNLSIGRNNTVVVVVIYSFEVLVFQNRSDR